MSQTEERILYCGTYDEYYYIIINKIGNNYKINISDKYFYFVNHIYDVRQKFIKYVKIMIDFLYQRFNKNKKQYNKFDLLYYNIMLLDKTNVKESKKILKYLKNNDLIKCKSNSLDTYLHNKLAAKCNFKNNDFILTNNILNEIQCEYKINPEIK
jgi:hypothetical protein